MMRVAVILFLSCLAALSQPAPILRNALTTNSLVLWISSNGVVQATSISNINFVRSSSMTWLMTNSLGIFHISAVTTSSGGSLGVGTNMVVMGYETNLLFSAHPGITLLGTNVMGTNFIDIGPDWAIVVSQSNLTAASNLLYNLTITSSNTLYGVRGQVRVNTNGVFVGAETNINFVQGSGLLILATNNAGSNGIQQLVDWTQVASQTNLNNASNVLRGVSGSVRVNTNGVFVGSESNLNFVKGNAITYLATNNAGSNGLQINFTTFIDITSPPYNAVGDGATDDTLAFQNACTNVGANIAVPYRSAGYLITNVFITNGVTLFGVGGQSKLIFNPIGTGIMLNGTNSASVTIRNLELDGTNNVSWQTALSGGARVGIQIFSYGGNSKLDNLNVHGFDDVGIRISSTNTSSDISVTLSSNNVIITHCDVRKCFHGIVINTSSADYIQLNNCRTWECNEGFSALSFSSLFSGCEAFLNNYGFRITKGRGSIVGCMSHWNNYPLLMTTSTGYLISGTHFYGGTNRFFQCAGILVEGCSGSINLWDMDQNGECWVRNNIWGTNFPNTVTHSVDNVIFSANSDFRETTAAGGNVIGEHGLYAKSNVVFQGNSSFTNSSGTNFIAGYQRVNASIVSNSFALLNFGPQVGSVWTCTNATTGEGRWSTNQGFILLSVQSALIPTAPAPALDQGTNNTWRLLFDDTTNEIAYYQFPLPWGYYTNANVTLSYSTLAAAANKSNVWEIATMVVPGAGGLTINVDSYNGVTEFTQQVNSTAGYLNTATVSMNATSAIAGDMLKLRITRKGTNTFDNNTGDTALHGVMVTFDRKAL